MRLHDLDAAYIFGLAGEQRVGPVFTLSTINSQPSTKRLSLLIAGINWPPETFITRLIEGLSAAGISVTVACPEQPMASRNGVEWLRTPSWETAVPLRLARVAGMALRAKISGTNDLKLLASHMDKGSFFAQRLQTWNRLLPFAGRRFDAIYFPWNSVAIACLPVFALGIPVVVSCRGTQVNVAPHGAERSEMRDGLRETFEHAAAVHCVSEAIKRDACEIGLDPVKATVIRPAVDANQFCPASARASRSSFSIVTVGTLIWVKGHEWALQAVRLLKDRGIDVEFHIIGDGPDRQRVTYTIHDLGLQDCVRLHGRLSPPEILRRLQDADAFLLSSLSEGISNAVLEAMACGLPIVTTNCGGMNEAVTNGVEGFVVPVRNAEAMAAALLTLAGDVALRENMGKAARARVVRDFTLEQQIGRWLDLFNSVLAQRGHESTRSSLPRSAAKESELAVSPRA